MESEFFGYRKGAFTGAERSRWLLSGRLAVYVFLDEVASLPLSQLQKLLRAIQERKGAQGGRHCRRRD